MKDGLKVVIDLQFYDLMVEKELNSLVKQLSYCHAINRKMQNPFNFILTSLTEQR
jgi:Trm5-related predicted tRNA methylase